MMIGVVGLGLIGGSMAKAINSLDDHSVYGYDTDQTVVREAVLLGAIEEELREELIPMCDMIIIALYPRDTVAFVEKYRHDIKKGSVIMDTCGVKQCVWDGIVPIAEEDGFWFVGCHPMAGIEHGGFAYSKKSMFSNASVILLPQTGTPIEIANIPKQLVKEIGFTNCEICEPDKHDRIIAYTSQLPHVLSSAFIKSPTARENHGFTGGSYDDMTRVANMNEVMWTELFLENAENLADEIDALIGNLQQYSDAIRANDEDTLCALLREGRELKTEIDKKPF
ncbi:MAG: prephenate dehydrogenase/arogenate dehydrogenase family protein [Anaerovoracaceae bacterium]|nr:prephenate dehydrogenase/arogenate dehydrogenase family protein [Anaerovoracaceae bacterium]